VPTTPASTLTRARQQALAAGLHHVYTGNVRDARGQSTYCAECSELLIERDGYQLGQWRVDARGRCSKCGAHLAGCFDPRPGHWGARREQISIFPDTPLFTEDIGAK